MITEKICVSAEFHKMRLDAFLAEYCSVTRSQVKKWVEKKYITRIQKKKNSFSENHLSSSVGEEKYITKAGEKLFTNDIIILTLPEETSPQVSEIALKNIIYEDDFCIVVNKPAGIVTHPDTTHTNDSVLQRVLAHCELSSIGVPDRPGVVHRLDKDTSGVMVFAKTDDSHMYLSNLFSSRKTKKYYLALVHGKNLPQEGTIDSPIVRDGRNRKKMTVSSSDKAKHAVSHFKVLEQFANCTLVKVHIETGRTHQIRVHFSSIGHPIVGDPIYGNKKHDELFAKKVAKIPRLLLHAHSLAFVLFSQKSEKEFIAELAEDFQEILKKLYG